MLVNNAGIFYGIDHQDQSFAYLKKIFDVNYFGTLMVAAGLADKQQVPRRRLEDAFLSLVGGETKASGER